MINEFDLKAREWDTNGIHIDRAKAIAGAIQNTLPLKKYIRALEFGAGTGLLSFFLKPWFSDITLMDTSVEMINVLKGKINGQGIHNMKPVLIELEQEDYADTFDLIYTSMVFHHLKNLEVILDKFHKMLVPGGYVAIADLYPEDGSFHGEGFTGHKGFDLNRLSGKVLKSGFSQIRHQPCYTIKKTDDTGQIREYPVFLLTACKEKLLQ
jgi:2-polyprenyl-3-methyl-5-hydroxy-6-metoxy-1,4-benzoquinol methylase